MKKRIPLLALAALLLGACAPAVVGPQPPAVVQADPDASSGLAWAGDTLWFKAGFSDVQDLALTISGTNVRVNAPQFCQVQRWDVVCTVPALPAGKNFVLPMRGSNLSAVAVYKRGGVSYSSAARR